MLMAIAAAHWLWRSLDTSSTSPLHTNLYITTRAGAFTNLPTAGKVVTTKVGCGRSSRQT
jgi:hypothetical protein